MRSVVIFPKVRKIEKLKDCTYRNFYFQFFRTFAKMATFLIQFDHKLINEFKFWKHISIAQHKSFTASQRVYIEISSTRVIIIQGPPGSRTVLVGSVGGGGPGLYSLRHVLLKIGVTSSAQFGEARFRLKTRIRKLHSKPNSLFKVCWMASPIDRALPKLCIASLSRSNLSLNDGKRLFWRVAVWKFWLGMNFLTHSNILRILLKNKIFIFKWFKSLRIWFVEERGEAS